MRALPALAFEFLKVGWRASRTSTEHAMLLPMMEDYVEQHLLSLFLRHCRTACRMHLGGDHANGVPGQGLVATAASAVSDVSYGGKFQVSHGFLDSGGP